VRVGDFITRVDSRDVEREPMSVLKELILGPQGTQVQQNRSLVVLALPPSR
jgi:C-terminal processing protease CtpA/Prc